MTDLSLDDFRTEATAFLDANAAPKPAATDFVWGQGDDDVALFEEVAPDEEARPEIHRGEGVMPVTRAAIQAVNEPGTELDGTEVAGRSRTCPQCDTIEPK